MQDLHKLVFIKITHTLIWAFMVAAIFYVLISGILNQINGLTWICVGLVLIEAFILILFRWHCPLTVMARKYSDSTQDNFDIYLPNWLAKHNKTIFGTIFTIALIFIMFRVL